MSWEYKLLDTEQFAWQFSGFFVESEICAWREKPGEIEFCMRKFWEAENDRQKFLNYLNHEFNTGSLYMDFILLKIEVDRVEYLEFDLKEIKKRSIADIVFKKGKMIIQFFVSDSIDIFYRNIYIKCKIVYTNKKINFWIDAENKNKYTEINCNDFFD